MSFHEIISRLELASMFAGGCLTSFFLLAVQLVVMRIEKRNKSGK